MSLLTLLIFTVIQVAVRGQTVTPVFVQSNAPVILTCPADDQATTLTWTGPGGSLYVTGTTVEAGLSDLVKSRISARQTGRSYTLTFTEFRSSDTGIYTCTVDGTVDIQMVIVQGVTSASSVYTRQRGKVTLQCPDTGGSATWSVTSILLLYTQGTQFNPAIPDDTRTRLSVTRQDGTYNLHVSDVQLSDAREYRCNIGVTDTLYHLLLYAPPVVVTNTTVVKGLIGDNMTIEVEFYSRPSVSPSDVTWTRGFNRAPLPDKSVSSLDTKSIQMSFHGVDVKVKGYVAVLKMNTMTEGDFDDYTVTVENSQGKENYTVHMISTGPPTPPLYLLQKQITSNSITVQWIQGSDRGLKQTFVIGYRSDVTADYTYSDDIPDEMKPIITYTLDGLTMKTLYSIRVHAQNGIGISKSLMLNIPTNLLFQGKEASNEAKNEALYSAGVALISVSSVLFVRVVALAVFIIINKRKSLPRSEINQAMNKSSSKDDDHHNVDATPSSVSMYEDINDHEQRKSGKESNYEVLGGQSLPNVYEDLKRVKDGPDSNYENTAV